MKIYIDSDFKCHVSPGEGLREFDVPFFDGKSPEFIEGYRYVPPFEKWVKPNGIFFWGEMVSPWKDYAMLAALQKAYEEGQAVGGGSEALIEAADVAYKEGVNSAYD